MLRTQVRPAGPGDAAALHDLLAGLSPESGYRRFLVGVGAPSARMVAALLRRDPTHGAWVCTAGGRLVGHAIWGADDGAAELGVVVTDAWQRRGVGRSLTAAAATEARAHGLSDVRMHVHARNRSLVRRLSTGATDAVLADGMVTVTRPLVDLLGDPSPAPGAVEPWTGAGQVLKVFWARSKPWATRASTASAARSTW
ncbi:MAG TPA: GNAT family N-acetyltransferase [Actinomycetes bacterium]|nr:GNAT family N-acetyltransferase [Actinomycetes bacterium]